MVSDRLTLFGAVSYIHLYIAVQAKELVQTEGWSRHDLQKALVQVYLRMDELLMRDEARPELEGLAGDASPTDSGWGTARCFENSDGHDS